MVVILDNSCVFLPSPLEHISHLLDPVLNTDWWPLNLFLDEQQPGQYG